MKNIILFGLLFLPIFLVAQERVGIGTISPQGKLHLKSNSGLSIPQLRLTEEGDDYARIKYENDQNPGVFWDIAARADSMSQIAKLNFYFKSPDATGDRMTILGNGDVGIGNTSPEARLDIKGGDWNLEGGNAGDFRVGTPLYNLRIGIATGGGGAGIARIFTGQGVGRMIFGTDDTRRMVIYETGNVGIGLDNPLTKLHINGDFRVNDLSGTGDRNVIVDGNGKFKIGTIGEGDTDWLETASHVITPKVARLITSNISGAITTNYFLDMNSGGLNKWQSFNSGTPFGISLKIQNESAGDLVLVEGGGNVGIGGAATSKLTITGQENNGSIASLEIKTSPLGDQMLIDNNEIDATGQGQKLFLNANSQNPVSIGTHDSAQGYMLNVDGKIIAEEVRVQLIGSWPDYVFSDKYQLKSIEEVESHIKTNGHLPGIPKAEVIEEEGLILGEMQKKMMEKIEELTLHIINLNNRIKELESN